MNNRKLKLLKPTTTRRLFALLFSSVLLFGGVIPFLAQDRGNTTAQEYGDAVYRQLDPSASFGYDYNHTAIFAGFDSGNNGIVLQALGSGYVTHEEYFNYAFKNYGSAYYGAYTLNNRSMTFADRKSVVTTAISLVNAAIPYPSTFPLIPVCIVYYGASFDGTVADISNIRCDGFVEFCYEKNNFRVWRNQDYVDSTWNIVLYPDLNNNRPDITRNPENEASPWTQRGAPCATGPNTEFGCGYYLPDTKMTSAAIINLPTYQVTTNGGPGYLDVTVQATDESGIHLIGVVKPGETSWTYSPTQPQHATSASYAWTVRITNSGVFYYAAIDNGFNVPSGPATSSVTLIVPPAGAKAPSAVSGDGFLCGVTGGIFPFASYGYYLFLPANSGNTYQIVGIYAVANSTGTYGYAVTGPSTAALNFSDSVAGVGILSASFATPNSGSFYSTITAAPAAYQAGNYVFVSSNAPSSVAGQSYSCTVSDGISPFATAGSLVLRVAPSGNTYTITGDGVYTTSSSGTYSYALANRSTGRIQLSDSFSGASTVYIGFTAASSGGFAVTQPATGAFQTGTFVVLDTTAPTVSLTNPATAKTYTNAQTVAIFANATDNMAVASVAFYDGAALKGTDTIAPYTHDWPFSTADNGVHTWTARAYDVAGNASTSSPVALTVSIDFTSPTVAITSPTNGQVLATSPVTVAGTTTDPGSPASGLRIVQVRVNGGSWSNATGTTSWTRSIVLSPCPNTIEARSLDNAGNYSAIASNFVSYTPPNTIPNRPANVSPAAALTAVALAPSLQATAFSDVDCVGDTHAASQWQVLNSAGAIVVADSGTDTVNKVSWTLPTKKLAYGSNYVWRVRYQDSRSGWSSNSAQTAFTTISPLLTGVKQGTTIVLNWPTNALGFNLQWTTNLGTTTWSNATPPPVLVNGQWAVTNGLTNNLRLYRLKKP